MVLFPGVTLPITVGRSKSLQLVREAAKKKQLIGVVCQKDMYKDDPDETDDLYPIGSMGEIIKILEMPDGNTTVILQGKQRFHLDEVTSYFRTLPEISRSNPKSCPKKTTRNSKHCSMH